ncbi:YbhB/YbcL family Raf kinase inhibitor-like protein [Sorangium sp. So ce131]|uniref:YbhB/YbcL family Raf kinase inhibitor-like protein n=1 Tax=Sorangium sp. So ce131 TaxID=3133282 RepID=UPI003F6367BB
MLERHKLTLALLGCFSLLLANCGDDGGGGEPTGTSGTTGTSGATTSGSGSTTSSGTTTPGGTGGGGDGGGGGDIVGPGEGGGGAGGDGGGDQAEFRLTSEKITPGQPIPPEHTCAGVDESPPLTWTPGPAGTMSYAILFLDTTLTSMSPPNPNGYHYAIYDIPASVTSLPGALPAGATLTTPVAAKQKSPANPFTSAPANKYFGPCPNAIGNTTNTDTYEFRIFALDVASLPGNLNNVQAVEAAILEHDIGMTALSGTSDARPRR